MAKDKEYNKLIHTTRWLKLRRDVLTAHPLCQRCKDNGLLTPATEVHHIRPVEEAFTHAERVQRMLRYIPSWAGAARMRHESATKSRCRIL